MEGGGIKKKWGNEGGFKKTPNGSIKRKKGARCSLPFVWKGTRTKTFEFKDRTSAPLHKQGGGGNDLGELSLEMGICGLGGTSLRGEGLEREKIQEREDSLRGNARMKMRKKTIDGDKEQPF